MNIEVVRTKHELEAIKTEWNALLARSASQAPFLRHEYMTTWWNTLGGGEWTQGELYVVLGRDAEKKLVGIAPLFLTKNHEGETTLMLLGSIEISDFLDVITPQDQISKFIHVLLEHLNDPTAPPWQVLDMYNILETSSTLLEIKRWAEQNGWHYTQERLKPAPYIPLPQDWEGYLANLDKKQRHELRRKMRQAAGYPLPTKWYIVTEEETLNNEMESFLSLMAQDPHKADFLTEAMREQMVTLMRAAFQAGWLLLIFLQVGQEKAAGYLNFDFNNRIWVYNSGIDFRFRDLSPGWVLLGHLMEWAIEQGREEFDFMRGDESYKYRLGGINRFVVRATSRR
ncbi:MAG: GNAT family N-acetyltransferase [Chloroflexota bacterium]